MRNLNSFSSGFAAVPLYLVTRSHQNSVVNCGSQLNGTDKDTGNERKHRSRIAGNTQIDEDGKLNRSNQNNRQ